MGYSTAELRISLRLDNHGGEERRRDLRAVEDLKSEIAALIASDADYRRIALLGAGGRY